MKLYIGTNKDNELVYIEWDKTDNEQRDLFSLSGGTYREPLTEEQGKQQAKEHLEDGELWRMAVEGGNTTQGLNDWVEDVLNIDGWEMNAGEYYLFGEHKGEDIYLGFSSCGQHQEKLKDFKNLWIDEKDYKEVLRIWDKYHIKSNLSKEKLKELYSIMENLFEKYKKYCSDEEALNQYLEDIYY